MGNTISAAQNTASVITTAEIGGNTAQDVSEFSSAHPSLDASALPPAECPMHKAPVSSPSECPMHNKQAELPTPPAECPMHREEQQSFPSECPMSGGAGAEKGPAHQAGLHYGEGYAGKYVDINPLNQEGPPNQKPSPDQPFTLPTERQVSSIPKADGKDDNWVYPSPQMFWNAMLRKGWRWRDDDLSKQDMHHIIRIHNVNNEMAWQEVGDA
ncbi:Cytochrome c-type heme lyase [Chionoecetes opilio]|uniref:Holocytochrome c-type synthase n=1 Tax=Chionoecetes opilio TaxID=41210 RepID=A0A8J5CMG7_CHIOP|nr:Cytochrome c-type heme lyase [Chionoecetes opilio]